MKLTMEKSIQIGGLLFAALCFSTAISQTDHDFFILEFSVVLDYTDPAATTEFQTSSLGITTSFQSEVNNTVPNGAIINDASTDGASTDGASTNGASTDGASTNGASTDGASTNSASTDGASTDGTSTESTTAIDTTAPTEKTTPGSTVNTGTDMPLEDAVLEFLFEVYSEETGNYGFLYLNWSDTSTELQVSSIFKKMFYDVYFENGRNLSLIEQGVINAQIRINLDGHTVGIIGNETANQYENTKDGIRVQIIKEAESKGCGPSCQKGEICYVEATESEVFHAACTNSCVVFNIETSCDVNDGIGGSAGECRFNEDYTAYCYCNDWGLWGLYSDQSALFHNNQCISVDFLMAVCIGGVCLILTILLITICCLAKSNHDQEKELEDIRDVREEHPPYDKTNNTAMANPMYERNWKNPANSADAKANLHTDNGETSTEDIHLQSRDQLHRGYSANSSLNGAVKGKYKKRESDLYMPIDDGPSGGYYNASFHPEPGAPWDSKSSDVTETDAYKNFKAHVDHIDPKANYNIKRPNLAVRPTDGLYNMHNERDVPMPSFKI